MIRSQLPGTDVDLPYEEGANSFLQRGEDRVLLVNPPAYDSRLPWARWIKPIVLLRLASYFRSSGIDVRFIDALHHRPGERLRRQLFGSIELDGVKVNRWRFGLARHDVEANLYEFAQQGWIPSQIYIEGLATYWWQGAKETVEVVRTVFPDAEVLLIGAYPTLAALHASEHSGADQIVSRLPSLLSGQVADFSVYEDSVGLKYVWMDHAERNTEEIVAEIVGDRARRSIRHVAIADADVAKNDLTAERFRSVLEGVIQSNRRVRLYAIGNITPATLVAYPELAGLMKRAGYGEVYFADDRFESLDQLTEDRIVENYRQAAEVLHGAGFDRRKTQLNGTLSIGRLGEGLAQRTRLATRVAHEIGSLVLWPYQPMPEECAGLPLEEQNGKLFPFRGENGATYRDYLDLLGLAAVLNAKYRQRTFDFLGSGLVPTLFRSSLSSRAWEPPDDVKGSLRVAPPTRGEPDASLKSKSNCRPGTMVVSHRREGERGQLVTEKTFPISSGPAGFKRALFVNPPVYDAQYWARWSQPAGLLRLASHLRQRGFVIDLIDCMETDAKGYVPKTRRILDGQPLIVERDDIAKPVYHFGLSWEEFERRLRQIDTPDQVWITSIMTYWWESTRDAIQHVRRIFPKAEIIVGGIYPTLAPEHAAERLGADVVFVGEVSEASCLPTDLSLYRSPPSYAILTTSRGCPWECHYCSARTLNGGSNKMRVRDPEDVLDEIEFKQRTFGIRRFGFYEDNALALKGHLQRILELIIERGLRLDLYAPEGFETRLLTVDLLRTMKQAGFEKIHLPFEALRWETNLGWNRRHASTASFERALSAAIEAGFKPRTEEINAFVLFGLPDDALELILDGVLYVHHMVGSIIPMLFTPVPGTHIFREHESYLLGEHEHGGRQWDLHDLNGKLLPFLEYNRQRYPGLRASDYLQLEGLMSVLNKGKVLRRSVNLCDSSLASEAFRSVATRLIEEAVR